MNTSSGCTWLSLFQKGLIDFFLTNSLILHDPVIKL